MDGFEIYKNTGIPLDRQSELSVYEYRLILINIYFANAVKSEEGIQMLNEYADYSRHETDFDIDGLLSIMH